MGRFGFNKSREFLLDGASRNIFAVGTTIAGREEKRIWIEAVGRREIFVRDALASDYLNNSMQLQTTPKDRLYRFRHAYL